MSQKYTQYLVDHITNVENAYNWLVDHKLVDISKDMSDHDLSKYGTDEYTAYDDYFYGEKTNAVKDAFDYAWLHHIHANPHHWQHWVLINDEDGTKALEMPKEYVYEMIADWWAFSWKSGNLREIFEWYKNHKKNIILHEKTRKLVEDILAKIKKILDEEEAENELSR